MNKWWPHIKMGKGHYRVFWRMERRRGYLFTSDEVPYRERIYDTNAVHNFLLELAKREVVRWATKEHQ